MRKVYFYETSPTDYYTCHAETCNPANRLYIIQGGNSISYTFFPSISFTFYRQEKFVQI